MRSFNEVVHGKKPPKQPPTQPPSHHPHVVDALKDINLTLVSNNVMLIDVLEGIETQLQRIAAALNAPKPASTLGGSFAEVPRR